MAATGVVFLLLFVLKAESISTKLLYQLTGSAGINSSRSVDIQGGDLGILFNYSNDDLYMALGDTFGFGPSNEIKTYNWRSNTMALLATPFGNGTTNTSVLMETADWYRNCQAEPSCNTTRAQALFQGAHQASGQGERTRIPTTIVAQPALQHVVIWYMSVREFDGDNWTCNNASITLGTSKRLMSAQNSKQVPLNMDWLPQDTIAWSSSSNTLMFAAVQYQLQDIRTMPATCRPNPRYIYLFATPCGRFGNAILTRVPHDGVTHTDQYEYLQRDSKRTSWTKNASLASPILSAPVGELSVVWHRHQRLWLATYSGINSTVLLRFSPCFWSDWSDSHVLITQAMANDDLVYGGFTHPQLQSRFTFDLIYSRWNAYNTFLARVNISDLTN
eukprot:TRINITY_DN9733_c0_g2_i1.p1 TRINITY_DN9733_c0_g2~~TRINITY_DN9733_c0_g2_i1.p1  ORF type:complete len:389 (+),score=44.04 TRINITY_DN9733_c0_g2_i1:1098-2264(+)